ncbi:hypothetical protein ACFO1B_04835 [Dactylosporangium siamense]|uniref:Uncharacterized protein n=1 Tax=Dactylosporangium siamense TaxID=685454 RepID=A0A919PGF7_9ACTN|nr:hypothetical protein [Dactylosporangium siamense]GIG42786.1 hypothetical protein Dsi01nite_008270 [Dactylosporangium siamense]
MSSTDDLSWLRHRALVRSAPAAADDLSWIRHRRRPADTTTPATRTAPAPPATSLDLGGGNDTSLDLPTGPAPAISGGVSGTPTAPPATNTSLDLSGGATSLDLGGSGTSLDLPTGAPAHGGTSLDLSPGGPPPPPSRGGTSLDLSASPDVPGASPTVPGTSLDLSPGPAPSPAPAAPGPPGPAAPPPAFTPPRTQGSAPTVLSPRQPSVQLTRLQSGIGALTFEAAWSPDEGFVLGCAYQMDSGWSSVLRQGETFGPLVLDRHAGHQRLRLDLLHGRHLQRLIVFGVPAVDPGPHWAGTLLIGTHGQARIEVPVQPPPPGPTVLLSLYNVDGEIVLRAEAQTVPGRIRDACLAFGYDRIAWRDADTAIPPA